MNEANRRAAVQRMQEKARQALIEKGGLSRGTGLKRTGTLARSELKSARSTLAKESPKRKVENRAYYRLKAQYLQENPSCVKCGGVAIDVHHSKGRTGKRLTDVSTFVSCCRNCHNYFEAHWNESLENGWSFSKHIGAVE